jgi:hypothetical protein
MKISELIAVLQQKLTEHGDREVQTTWEGTTEEIERRNVWLSKAGPLYIDANCLGEFYKERFAADPKEGEQ